MSMKAAFAPAEAKYKAIVMHQTFGHLRPSPRVSYEGHMLFTQGEYGDLVAIRTCFKDLPSSPWFYDHVNDFIFKKATEPGVIYSFVGRYVCLKNGSGRFVGKVRPLRIPEPGQPKRNPRPNQRQAFCLE